MRFSTFRATSMFVSALLTVSSIAPGFAYVPRAKYKVVARLAKRQQGQTDFTDSPGPVDVGSYPQRDSTGRGGVYTSDALAAASTADQVEAGTATGPTDPGYIQGGAGDTGDDMVLSGRPAPLPRNVQMTSGNSLLLDYVGLTATINPLPEIATADHSVVAKQQQPGDSNTGRPLPGAGTTPPTYGDAFPWEGTDRAGGSEAAPGYVNLQTGNRFTVLPLTTWHAVGDLDIELNLYHNSQDHKDIGWGMNWRSTYDMRVIYSGPSSNQASQATVSYPTGSQLVYTKATPSGGIAGTNIYYPPTGFYDALTRVSTGWTLRTEQQITYIFDSNGYLTGIADRYNNRIYIVRTSNTPEYITKVYDTAGEQLTFTNQFTNSYSGNHYTTVLAPGNNTFNLSYSNSSVGMFGVLRSVQFPTLPNNVTPSETFYYDTSAAITQEIALDGTISYCTYDSLERLTSFSYNVPFYTNPIAQTGSTGNLKYTYSYGSTSTTRTDPYGKTVVQNYDSGTLRSEVDEANYSETNTWDLSGNLIQKKDARGNSSYYTFDQYGNMTSSQDPKQYAAGVKEQFGWNSWNDLTSETDSRGYATTYHRDQYYGTILSVVDGANNTIASSTYNPNGTLASFSTNGATTTYSYNSAGRPTSVATPDETFTVTYSSQQPWLATSVSDGLGRQTTNQFDSWSRLYGVIRTDGSGSSQLLDTMGRVTTEYDYNGNYSSYTYDAAGRPSSNTNRRGDVRHFIWQDMDRLVGYTDGNNHTKQYSYSVRSEPTGYTLADGSSEYCQHDGNGNQTSRYSGGYQVSGYTYDSADNLATITYPSGTGATYSYDTDSRTIGVTDSTGSSSWAYDGAGRLTTFTSPQGSLAYTFDQWGRETQVDEGAGVKLQYSYSANRLASITKLPESETTTLAYDSIGRVSQRTYPNGTVETFAYDSLDRNSSIAYTAPGGTPFLSESYSFDANSNVSQKTSNGATTSYSYDAEDQILTELAPNFTAAYTYDHNGNRLRKTLNNGTPDIYTYDSGDKLQTVKNGSTTVKLFNYDVFGRTSSVTSVYGTSTVGYDYEDRPISISVPNHNDTFTYNVFDARVGKTDSTGSHAYLRDGEDPTSSVLNDGVATYSPGISRHTSAGTSFLHSDYQGTVRAQSSSSNSVTQGNTYDAFGLLQSLGGQTNPFGYAGDWGYQEDPDTGLKLIGHRIYDPSIGRFLTRDPAYHGANWFNYCDNSPVSGIDSDGQIHVVVTIGKSQTGEGKEFADPGDDYTDDDGVEHKANGGELIRKFPCSNRPGRHHTPYPDGTYTITGIEHNPTMGSNYPVTRGKDATGSKDGPGSRGKWLHTYTPGARDSHGHKKTWRSGTYGCVRTAPDPLNKVCKDIQTNKKKKNRKKPRITVKHVPEKVPSS